MNRRQWLLGSGAAIASAPLWLRQAFATNALCPTPAELRSALSAGLAAAKSNGKPLLVLTVPADASARWLRGHCFGEWLNFGGDATLADLAHVEVVCALTTDLAALVPATRPGDPLMRLVDGDRVLALDKALTAPAFGKMGGADPKAAEAVIDEHIATLTGLLRGALAGNAAARATRSAAALSAADLGRVRGAVTELDPVLADRAAAAASAHHGRTPALIGLLATGARKRLVDAAIPGSLWARASGCGEHIEGIAPDQQMAVGCGMGFVAGRSQRFVRFFSDC